MTTCDECGFTYDTAKAEHAGAAIVAGIADVARLLLAPEVDPSRRPRADTWSPLEYGCHLRDVLLVQRERVLEARRAVTPGFSPMGRDERVEHDGYADQDSGDVARQLGDAAALFANVLARLGPGDWDRTVVYNYSQRAERPLRWVAVHTVHEVVHHTLDIRRQQPAPVGGRIPAPVEIRPAEATDLPALTAIQNALIESTTYEWTETPYTVHDRETWLADRRRAGDPVLVAVDGDEVVGFAAYGDFRDSRLRPGYRFTVEHTIHVTESHQGAGTGRALLLALVDHARRAGIRVMVGAIDGSNTGSIAFHARHGFVEVARMPGVGEKWGRRLDLVLMQLDLTGEPSLTYSYIDI
jgi:L-amino acid N-acyltransferase YncA